MPRTPFNNHYIGPDGEERRAWQLHIDDHQRRDNAAGLVFSHYVNTPDAAPHVMLIPRVPAQGFGLGRVSFVFDEDQVFSSTHYRTFTLYRYFTATDGTRKQRGIPNGSWGTNEVAPQAFVPYSLVFKQPLSPGETLTCDVTTTGVPVDIRFTIQVEEMFGREG